MARGRSVVASRTGSTLIQPPAIIQRTLSNGLRVVLGPNPAVPIVGVAISYDVGSRNELPGTSGFAHLFEHLMFQGSEHVGKAQHFQLIDSWGGSANATTGQERTNYFQQLPSDQLPLALWLEADRMRALAITPQNFENQRQTVMEERRQRVDDRAYGPASVLLGELSYSSWAYAHPVVGSWEDLERASLDQVVRFHRTWYRPDNAVLSVAGDFEPERVLDLVQEWFGPIPAGGTRPAPDVSQAERHGARVELVEDPRATLPALFINHLAPSHGQPDFYVHQLIDTLLLGGHSARAWRRLVLDQDLAVGVGGGHGANRGPSLFSLAATGPAGADLDALREAWLDELGRLARDPVPDDEITKVCNQIRAARVFSRESTLRRALELARSVLFYDDPRWEERYLDRIRQVSTDDIMRVAARDFSADRRVELRVLPGGRP